MLVIYAVAGINIVYHRFAELTPQHYAPCNLVSSLESFHTPEKCPRILMTLNSNSATPSNYATFLDSLLPINNPC